VSAIIVIAIAILVASRSGDKPESVPAALIQPALPPAPVAPPPVVVQTPPNEALGTGSDTSTTPDPEPQQPVKKHHHTNTHSKSEASKKHWDPNTLFPK